MIFGIYLYFTVIKVKKDKFKIKKNNYNIN